MAHCISTDREVSDGFAVVISRICIKEAAPIEMEPG